MKRIVVLLVALLNVATIGNLSAQRVGQTKKTQTGNKALGGNNLAATHGYFSEAQLEAYLNNSGVVSKLQFIGKEEQIGSFMHQNGNTGMTSGLIISSGDCELATGPNTSESMGTTMQGGDDTDLKQIAVNTILYDAGGFEFDLLATSDYLTCWLVFASEEYNEYTGSSFNDLFGVFVSENGSSSTNIATIPGSKLPIRINNVNQGAPGMNGDIQNVTPPLGSTAYSKYYTSNPTYLPNDTIYYGIEYDGFTKPFLIKYPMEIGKSYHFKFVIADAGDGVYDSGLLITNDEYQVNGIAEPIIAYTQSVCGNTVSVQNHTKYGIDYLWDFGDGTTSIQAEPPPHTYAAQGNYQVKLKAKSSANLVAEMQKPVIFNPEAELVNTQISHIDCNSSGKIKLEINSVASANMTYQWSDDNTVKNAQNINCSFIIEKEVPEAGSYTVTVTSNNHAYTFGPYNIVYSGNKLDLATNVKPACTKQANGEIELVFTNGNPTDIYWSHDTSLKSYIATGLPTGAYTINYTDNHGCLKTVNIEIGNKELPDQNNISVTPPDCNFDKGLIYVAVPESNGIASGTLLNSQNQVVAIQNSALTFIFSNIASGNYTLLYSDEEGCTTTLNLNMPDKQIPQSKLLTSTITDNNKTVSAILTQQGKAPYTYTWSDGFNGSVRSDLSAGKTYKVTVTDANGCTEILDLVIKPNSSDVVSGFTAFPVPADQYVMLRQSNPEQIDALTEIQVLDSSGKLYRIEKIREGEEIRLNTASLPNGLYFVHINSSNGEHILVLSVLH